MLLIFCDNIYWCALC